MRNIVRSTSIFVLLALFSISLVWAGEPLVVKTKDGKFIPAVASEWTKVTENKFRFVLISGEKASEIAKELTEKIAPIKVAAPDDLTLVFEGEKLSEESLLQKLADIPLGKEKAVQDALAALSGLGNDGGPGLSDLSGAGSIRASKKFELTINNERKEDPLNVLAKVLEVKQCEPLPTLVIKVTKAPRKGPGKTIFPKGKKLAVRGYYKITDDTKVIDKTDARTMINLKTKEIKPGAKIFGRPFLKDGDVWVLETIETQ